jgi:hypothetical protein
MRYNDLSKIIDYRENITTSSTELLVSFVLKYTDDFVKCFVAAVSILLVALFNALMRDEQQSFQLFYDATLTCIALEQYYFS